jgi:hypothetical protein
MARKYVDLRISSRNLEDVKQLVLGLRYMDKCCNIGASRRIIFDVDGDGSGDINVQYYGEEEKEFVDFPRLGKSVDLDKDEYVFSIGE